VIQEDIRQAALKAWVGVRRLVKAKTGAGSVGVLQAELEDMGMRALRVVLVRLEGSGTPGGRLAPGSAPGDAIRSDAFQMCLRRRHAAVRPNLHTHLATVAGRCVRVLP